MTELPNTPPEDSGSSPSLRPIPANYTLPSADRVKPLLIASGANEGQIGEILWFLGHAKEKALRSNGEVGELIEKDGSTISRVFNGKYGADLESICKSIRRYRAQLPLAYGDDVFVPELSVVRDLTTLCDLTRESRTIAIVCGPNQSGKTEALQYYAKIKNHGRTPYVRMPVGGGSTMFLHEVAKVMNISERNAYKQLRDRIIAHIDPSMLLIVDETHQALIGRSVKTTTMELIREVHDLCKCGVVLCGTDALPEMIQDARFKKFLGQTDNRGVLRRRVPAEPTRKDIRLLCEAYGLEQPEGDAALLVKQIAKTNGIGKLCKYFQMSRKVAANKKQELTWKHFLATHATLTAWARGDRSEKEEAED